MAGLILFHTHLAREFPDELERLHEIVPGEELVVAADGDEFRQRLPEAEVIVAAPQPATVLDTCLAEDGRPAHLKAHIVPFAGIDRVPLSWYARHGVLVASSHGNADVVAERALALLLAAAGRVVEFDAGLRQGRWHRRNDASRPFEYWRSLAGARVAVLGTGAIGCRVAELAAPLITGGSTGGELIGLHRGPVGHGATTDGATTMVTAEGRTTGEALARNPEQVFHQRVRSIEEAVAGVDAIIVTLPLTDATRGLLGYELLAAANQPVVVNVSRAEIIPEDDLFLALQDQSVYAAGVDVWYRYPQPPWNEGADALPGTRPFHHLPNLVLSPHAASHTPSGKRAQLTGALAHLEEFLKTDTMSRAIDPANGY